MNLNKDIQFISKSDLTKAITLIKGDIKGCLPQNSYEDICNAIHDNVNELCNNYNYTRLELKNINSIYNSIEDAVIYYKTLNTKKILQIVLDNIEIESNPIPMF